jgi:hypothetical protein
MGLGRRKETGFIKPVKYNPIDGRVTIVERVRRDDGQWNNEVRDITEGFQAIFDLKNTRVAWIAFPGRGVPPEVRNMVPAGADPGPQPSKDFKQGLVLYLKLAPRLGGSVRELMSSAVVVWDAINILHDSYEAEVADHAGELPEVTLAGTEAIEVGQNTFHQPIFKPTGWVRRPADLPDEAPVPHAPTPAAKQVVNGPPSYLDDGPPLEAYDDDDGGGIPF